MIYTVTLYYIYNTVKETVNRRARSRRHTELAVKSASRRLTLADVTSLVTQLQTLPCCIKDSEQLEVSISHRTSLVALV